MTAPVGSVQGLASGIQWSTMVDQIMTIESQRSLDPVTAQQADAQKRADAWKQFQGIAATFRDAAAALRDPGAFDVFTANASASPTSGRNLVSATAASGATPGTYSVEVLAQARAEKLSGDVFSSSSAARGLSGSFTLNGRSVTVVASDSLATLRDKINAADTGTSPSGVTATLLSSGNGARLVLTSDATGAAGIETVDDASGTFRALGFTDGTTTANLAANGATQTNRLSSATASVGSLLGITVPAATTIKAGGVAISVDLSVDSLSSIASKINTATGNSAAATVQTETVGGRTFARLVTNATIETDPAATPADSVGTLAALGFTKAGRGGAAQVVTSANAFTDASGGGAATAGTLLSDLQANGQSLGLAAGDKVSIAGTQGNGTAVASTFTVAANSTLQDLLSAIGSASTGFGAGTRPASAAVTGGRIALTDGTTGDSQLGLSLSVTRSGGGVISLGAFSTDNGGATGRARQVASGADAQVRVDGQVLSRASNAITDAIGGVTLNVLSAEAGTSVSVTVDHDTDSITKKIQAFATAYNAVRSFISTNVVSGGALANDSALRGMGSSLTSALLKPVAGLTGPYTTASMVGLQHDAKGVLSLDTGAFSTALQANYDNVRQLFSLNGATTDSELSFVSAAEGTQPSSSPYAVHITQPATLASVTGASWSTYATSGAPDTMSVADSATGVSGTISIANGDTIDAVVQRLNALFGTESMRLQATKTTDSRVQIGASDYGTTGGFTVAYTPGAGGDGTSGIGIAAQKYAGLDVAGSINGATGTGRGQYLTAASSDASAGILLRYSGTAARDAGTIALSIGVGGMLDGVATALAADNTGGAAVQMQDAAASADTLTARMADIQTRLDARRAALTKQFTDMEAAMAQAQALGATLTSQINGLQTSGL
ncbi:MAG: flagellar filament capping protein FliD [Gemmatimonadales bacterium]